MPLQKSKTAKIRWKQTQKPTEAIALDILTDIYTVSTMDCMDHLSKGLTNESYKHSTHKHKIVQVSKLPGPDKVVAGK